jgi:hypothetical protein
MTPFLTLSKDKNKYKSETIFEQYWNGAELKIMTKSDGKWTLWNHTQGKKVGSSKDWSTLKDRLYE